MELVYFGGPCLDLSTLGFQNTFISQCSSYTSHCLFSFSFTGSFYKCSFIKFCFFPRICFVWGFFGCLRVLLCLASYASALLQCKAYTQVIPSTLMFSAAMSTSISDPNFSISKLWSLSKALFSFNYSCLWDIFS